MEKWVSVDRRLVAAAAFLGAYAAALEAYFIFLSGLIPSLEVALNAILLTLFFAVATACWLAPINPLRKRVPEEFFLLLLAMAPFAGRGCGIGCAPTKGVQIPTIVGVAAVVLLLLARRLFGGANGRRISMAVVSVSLTAAALEFAERQEVILTTSALGEIAGFMTVFTVVAVYLSNRSALANSLAAILTVAASWTYAAALERPLAVQIVPPKVAAAPGKPSVLLVVMDTVRADHTSLLGYTRRTTPVLEGLAKESLVFDRAIASGNYSLPSHASLFTGVLPSLHGAHDKMPRFYPDKDRGAVASVPTLAETLGAKGFATAGVSANVAYLTKWTGLQKGFESFDDHVYRRVVYHPFEFPILRRIPRFDRSVYEELTTFEAPAVSKAALAYVTRVPQPFFLFLNYYDAHRPYYIKPGLTRAATDKDAREDVFAYDTEIAYVDRNISTVVEGLKASGRLDNTILIVVADHGEGLGDHGWPIHNDGAYESVLHVPILVRYPKGVRPGRVESPFGLHELPRLILDLVDGKSIDWAYEESDQAKVLAQVWTRVATTDTLPTLGLDPVANVIYAGRHKLIARATGVDELYDIATDPRETTNLLDRPTPEIEALRARMREPIRKLPPAIRGTDRNLTTADLWNLNALGYIAHSRNRN